jgi:uncharacterized protein
MHALIAPVLLIVSLGGLAWFHRNDRRNYKRFGEVDDSARRQRLFLRMAARNCALYLIPSLLGLALLGRLDALWNFPPELLPLIDQLPDFGTGNPLFLGMAAGAPIVGAVIGALLRILIVRRPLRASGAGNIVPLLPRNTAELLRILPLVASTGISEEVAFRLYLPLLITSSGGTAALAFGASVLIFGALHRYQGWIGVMTTTVLGAVLALLYFGWAGLAAPILIHLFINSATLVLRPALTLRFRPASD